METENKNTEVINIDKRMDDIKEKDEKSKDNNKMNKEDIKKEFDLNIIKRNFAFC